MQVKRLKEILADLDDNAEVFIRNSVNPFGNIQDLVQVELSTYSSFGQAEACVILNTCSSKDIEENNEGDAVDFMTIRNT